MNPDTGEPETPAHYMAVSWRLDLDYKIKRFEEIEERNRIEMEHAVKQAEDEALRRAQMSEQAKLAEQRRIDLEAARLAESISSNERIRQEVMGGQAFEALPQKTFDAYLDDYRNRHGGADRWRGR